MIFIANFKNQILNFSVLFCYKNLVNRYFNFKFILYRFSDKDNLNFCFFVKINF
jgi:hypothetical protein